MRTRVHFLIYSCLALMGLLSSCGEDRSGEYYALIATKTWIYEVMQENYLFYEDIPAEEKLDFFEKPAEFLASAASSRDQKNGYVFSHVDSVSSRATSTYPCFGMEAALVSSNYGGGNALRILYIQPDSPAEEAGLKGTTYPTVVEAVQAAKKNCPPKDLIFVGGSSFIVADLLANRDTLNLY